jgi:hypothetical protein
VTRTARINRNPCSILVVDLKASKGGGSVVIRPCGSPNTHVVIIGGDHLFAICSRHNARLDRAGVKAA